MQTKAILVLVAALLAARCHSSTNLAGDSRTDAPTDPSPDAHADVPVEVDAAPDTSPDGPPVCRPGDCPPGYFCDLIPGTCDHEDAMGVCAEIWTGGCDDYWDPECGCDGVTYGNSCERRSAGQSLRHPGECGDSRPCAPWLVECPPGEMCEAPPDSCWLDGVTGVCTPIRDDCGWLYDPQCGCDGNTYANVCERMASGEWLDHAGECGEPCGPDGYPPCAYSEFCEYPTSSCGDWGEGECMEVPTGGCPELWAPQCGCDHVTYTNWCYRQQARVSMDHAGEC